MKGRAGHRVTAAAVHPHRRAIVLAIIVTFLWSSSWVMVRWAIDDHGMSPILGAGLRYLLDFAIVESTVPDDPTWAPRNVDWTGSTTVRAVVQRWAARQP